MTTFPYNLCRNNSEDDPMSSGQIMFATDRASRGFGRRVVDLSMQDRSQNSLFFQ